jgi:penicillin-binding protein 1A
VVNVNGDWYYEEYARGNGVASLGLSGDTGGDSSPRPRPAAGPSGEQGPGVPGDKSLANSGGMPPPPVAPAPVDERRSILDLFRN